MTISTAPNPTALKSYDCPVAPTWCPGCGNFMIQIALKRALSINNIPANKTVLVFDVGCNGNGADKITANVFHGLHGRAISLAAGVSLANPGLCVVASAGDGGTFSEGVNHLIHAVRSNYKMLFIHHNNQNFALTTGQPSTTTPQNQKMNSAIDGVYTAPINPIDFVLSLNPSFVARSFSGDLNHMTDTIKQGLDHDGFAYVEILQTCPTYAKETNQAWYRERISYLSQNSEYDCSDLLTAKKLALMDPLKEIPLGIIYKNTNLMCFNSTLLNRKDIQTSPIDEVTNYPVNDLLDEFK